MYNINFLKKIFVFFILFIFLWSFLFANRRKKLEKNFFYKLKIEHNNKKKSTVIVMLDNKIYVNLKSISKYYQGNIEYKQLSREISIKFHNKKNDSIKKIIINIGSIYAYLNEQEIILERIPFIYGSHVFVPLSFLTNEKFNNFLGSYTSFDSEKAILYIKTQKFLVKNNLTFKDINQNKIEDKKPDTSQNTKKVNISDIDFDNNITSNKNFDIISKISKNNLETNTIDDNEAVQGVNSNQDFIKNNENRDNLDENIIIHNQKKLNKINNIVLDPGHGGKDPGATYYGISEKNITLDIAVKIKNILEKEYKKNVFLTREQDTFISLEDRVKKANSSKGELLVSIHINAAPNKKEKNGFEIYYLSNKASDKEAEKVAKRENIFLDMNETSINHILWSMKLNEYINESSKFAHFIDKNIKSDLKEINNNGIKQASFFVLKGVKMPAVLLELGYLSNKKELSCLLNQKIQENLAKIISKSIIEYENDIE